MVNCRLELMGVKPMFQNQRSSPFGWLVMTNLEGKSNFFELDVPEYAKNMQFVQSVVQTSQTSREAKLAVAQSLETVKRVADETSMSHTEFLKMVGMV